MFCIFVFILYSFAFLGFFQQTISESLTVSRCFQEKSAFLGQTSHWRRWRCCHWRADQISSPGATERCQSRAPASACRCLGEPPCNLSFQIFKRWDETSPILGVSKNRGTSKWMVYNGKSYLKWMIWEYPYFRKHTYRVFVMVNLCCLVAYCCVAAGPSRRLWLGWGRTAWSKRPWNWAA